MIVRVVGEGGAKDMVRNERRGDWETGRGETGRLHEGTTARRDGMRILDFGVILEVLFWGVVVGTVLFAVTAADIIG